MDRVEPPDDIVTCLLDAGLVTAAQVDLAVVEQRRRGGSLAGMLGELGFVPSERLVAIRARAAGISVADPATLRPAPEAAGLLPVELGRQLKALPLSRRDGIVIVAMADPCDVIAIDRLRQALGTELELVAASERDILNALDAQHSAGLGVPQAIARWLAEEPATPTGPPPSVREPSLDPLDAPVVQLVQEILSRAAEAGASDIHFEPAERCLRIRLRLDGVLVPDVLVPKPLQAAVTARLKVLGELDVAESRLPQDGRATFLANRKRLNLRLSTLPTQDGESVVVRLLPADASVPTLDRLELDPVLEANLRRAISRPYGVVVVTGPTGSGKTTTLYALLHELNQPDTAIFTLEDPVEMPLAGTRQTQIHEEAGLTYSVALRALLRQDPDVILVGETRDTETAQLMVRAALTGHQVLTTLHTNDAVGAIPRLIDMGVEPCLLPGSLAALVAQRLVRRLCPVCREPEAEPERLWEAAGLAVPAGHQPRAWRPRGCSECRNTGYRGRRALFELLAPDQRFHELIVGRASPAELQQRAREGGMRSLLENGLPWVIEGTTTLEELRQATRFD